MRTHYEVLGVSENASPAAIRQTYLRLLQVYHPDHNADPQAHKVTAALIEAYSVLSNPGRRKTYDRERGASKQAPQAATENSQEQSSAPHIRDIVCETCGVQEASLRSSSMTWVASFLLVTRRGVRTGVWCARCRAKQAAVWSTISGLVGWWGFPWGPIYTIPALYENAKGGKQDRKHNATLLQIVGFQLFQKERYAEAHAALGASLSLEPDQATSNFKASIPFEARAEKNSNRFFQALTAVPSILSLALVIACVVFYATKPSGYAAQYQAPQKSRAPIREVRKSTSGREQVNELSDQLATAVQANATFVGTHQEGTATIRDFQLDRAKYKEEVFNQVSSRMEPFLDDSGANANGFAASAYFNARLMGQSVSILQKFDRGEDIDDSIRQVDALQDKGGLADWLNRSRYSQPYRAILVALQDLAKHQTLGVSSADRSAQLKVLKARILELRGSLKTARNSEDAAVESTLVASHNSSVAQFNALVKAANRERILYQKTDLAFNKCLDPGILMSKFQQVNLITEESSAEESTELQ